jgi:hypothetical protein
MKKTKAKKKALKKKSPKKALVKKVDARKPKSKKTVKKKAAPQKRMAKSSFKPNPDKLAHMRQTFVTILWRHEALPPERVREIVGLEIARQFPTDFSEYFDHVNELLTKFRLIEEVPDKKPLHIRLAQRLEE